MMLVIDASVAFKFLVYELGSEQARDLIRGDEPMVAPDLVLTEVGNALWKRVKQSELLEIHAERSLAALPDFFARLDLTGDLVIDAFRLSFRLRHPIYDCVYLALAMRDEALLITADKKFVRAVIRSKLAEYVRLLEWPETMP
jgi:predicted nucleic acid-binding protein